MSDEATFVAAMAADPDNDLPRLVFADWLDENGQSERAAFIRLQCGSTRDDPASEGRANELLNTHYRQWGEPFQPLGGQIGYRRGFPSFLETDLARLVEHAHLLALAPEWEVQPTAERGEPGDRHGLWARLASSPAIARVRSFRFGWGAVSPSGDELAALLVPPLVNYLRGLRFGDLDEYEAGPILDSLFAAHDLRLEEFGVIADSYGGIGDRGCRRLAAHKLVGSLRVLELPNNQLGPDAAAALATSPHLSRLIDLDLAGGSNSPNEIGPDGARALAASDNFCHLESLNLLFNFIGDDGFVALVESPRLPQLRSLNVPGNMISDTGLFALANSSHLPELNWLNLCGSRHGAGITAAGVRALIDRPMRTKWTGLKLSSHPIGDEGAAVLADSPNCHNLTELLVSECHISFDGFVRLLESPHLRGVAEFNVSRNPVPPDEVEELKRRFGERVK